MVTSFLNVCATTVLIITNIIYIFRFIGIFLSSASALYSSFQYPGSLSEQVYKPVKNLSIICTILAIIPTVLIFIFRNSIIGFSIVIKVLVIVANTIYIGAISGIINRRFKGISTFL